MVKVIILKRVSMFIVCFVLRKYIKKFFGNFSGNLYIYENILKLMDEYFNKVGDNVISRIGK